MSKIYNKMSLSFVESKETPAQLECELRNLIDFDCENTLDEYDPSFSDKEPYNISSHDLGDVIKRELDVMSEEEFLKLKEDNKRLDELLTQKETEDNLKKLGINFIPGNPNNI